MGLPRFSVGQGNTQLYSGNKKAKLVNILREQGNEPNFRGHRMWRFGKYFWDNKTSATSADSDQPEHLHNGGQYNLQDDCTICSKSK